MNEQLFGLKIRNKLNTQVLTTSPEVANRLFEARQAALARHQRVASGFSLAGVGIRIASGWGDYARQMALALALISAVVIADDLLTQERAEELGEIDSALLADDLPISAYLDRGFDTWLHAPDSH